MPLLYLRDFSINFIALQGYIRHTLNKTNIAFCVRTEYHTGDKEIRGDFMEFSQIYLIVGGVLGGLLLITLVILFFVSRKSQKVMQSLLTLMTRPESARVQDAVRVLNAILADEMIKMESNFQNIRDELNAQITAATELKNTLDEQNTRLAAATDDATKKIAQMTQRLENTVNGLQATVGSNSWQDVEISTDRFSATVNDLLAKIDNTTNDTSERISKIQTNIDAWISAGDTLSQQLKTEFDSNTEQMKNLNSEYENMQQKLAELSQTTASGFDNVKASAADYADVMENNNKALDNHLAKMDTFGKRAQKQLTSQVNALTNTANVVAGQVRLSETSIESQVRKLTDAVETLMNSATSTEAAVRNISKELTELCNHFNKDITGFTNDIVGELKTVSGVANSTLENTKTAAGAFSESVRAMATGVRETLIEMNTAHTQLSGQSENLIKMSAETTAQLQPLSELIEKYYSALPDLARDSVSTGDNLQKIVENLNEKIGLMRQTVAESTTSIADSAVKLEDLAGQSRQQMIDLMADYSKAVNTMQTLNKQMMVARATAPMDAINSAPSAMSYGRISAQDFLNQSERMFEKMHEQTMDLTRAAGVDIPDVIWKKYHGGDKTVFSKWFAKIMTAADKKQVREMLKTNAAFRSQATQFVRSFDKTLNAAKQADGTDKLAGTLAKTDLGQIYIALKGHM